MYWVYLLQSQLNKKLYIGITNNLRRRLQEHNLGKSSSTRQSRPWELIYVEGYASIDDAKSREKNLKYFGKAYGQLKRRIGHSLDG